MTYSAPRRGPGGRPTAQAYANIGLETQVFSATPEQLISMLLDGARAAVIKAQLHMQQGQIAERGEAISKAIDIVDSGLKASVNKDKGGEVATHLITTYDLMVLHLTQANLHSDEKRLKIVEQMLDTLIEAWATATSEPK